MLYDYIQSQIFTKIINDEKIKKLQEDYPDFLLTTSAVSSTEPRFPALILQMLESPEIGQDLENNNVNGINAGFQIDVIDNQKTRTRVDTIMREVCRIMKSMRFNLRRAPDMDTKDEKRSILRATRYIAENDVL